MTQSLLEANAGRHMPTGQLVQRTVRETAQAVCDMLRLPWGWAGTVAQEPAPQGCSSCRTEMSLGWACSWGGGYWTSQGSVDSGEAWPYVGAEQRG